MCETLNLMVKLKDGSSIVESLTDPLIIISDHKEIKPNDTMYLVNVLNTSLILAKVSRIKRIKRYTDGRIVAEIALKVIEATDSPLGE